MTKLPIAMIFLQHKNISFHIYINNDLLFFFYPFVVTFV
jgi:hypothetical protein